jgi:VWFA-related protein
MKPGLAAASLVLLAQSPPPQQPAFRALIANVAVNVSVRAGNVPVAGLTVADFDITDNGVRQTITSLDVEAVPIDATLVLDVSGSTAGGQERLRRNIREIAGLLRPVDRFRLVTFASYVREVVPLQPARAIGELDDVPFGGATSAHDAAVATMIQRSDLDRRHLIVVITDAVDTLSELDAPTLELVASRSEAVLHIVLVTESGGYARFPLFMTHVESSREPWRRAAEATGGDTHGPGLFGAGPVDAFKKVFDDFRRSYVLRFTPTGVDPRGWHDLGVKVTRPGKYNIRARRGYFAR